MAHDHAYASWMVPLSCVDARLDTKTRTLGTDVMYR